MNATPTRKTPPPAARPLAWPGDPTTVRPEAVDLEAVAHVLAHTCRWGGRTRTYHSLAHHAVVASETVEALDGMAPDACRALALAALVAPARAAWLGDADAAERRDLEGVPPGAGPAFVPLKRRIRPVRPAHAVRLWLARLEALTAPPDDAGAGTPASPDEETSDVTHLSARRPAASARPPHPAPTHDAA